MFINQDSTIKAMEHPTLKVPYEVLNKKYRISQKNIDRELNHLNQSLTVARSTTTCDSPRVFNDIVENLKNLKRKAEESINDELEAAQICKKRLNHLKGLFENPNNVWREKRLDRLLVDHLLRSGYYESASRLTEKAELHNLTNMELFKTSRKVETSLMNGDTTKCLAWCYDNKSKLRKLNSTLEIQLRQQEFIELVKQNKRLEAIQHARKYLTINTITSNDRKESTQSKELEQIMGLLAYPPDTKIEPYRKIFDKSRWLELIEHFKQDNYQLFQLNSVSVFSVVLQAGLSALKTPQCYLKNGQKNPECPLCNPLLNELARELPYPHCSQSKLICSITGQPLNEHNAPMMLPNGYIYGELGLRTMANKNNGKVKCPKTSEEYSLDELKKVYVM